MGQIYTERKESGNDKLPILTVSIHTGVSDGALDETELGKRVKRSEDKSTYKIARKNDLVFNMMRAWQGAIGTVRTTGMVSPAYIVAYPNDLVEPIFMDYLVKCKQMIDSIHRLSYGVTDFRLRLYWDSFVEIPINVPSLEEQNKIASFLTLLDKRIAKQRELVENLKSYKRGLFLKMFPQNGERVPSLRFVGFSSEWSITSLRSIAKLITKGTTPLDKSGDGEVNFVKVESIDDETGKIIKLYKISTLEHTGYLKRSQLQTGDILFSIAGTLGRIALVPDEIMPANTNQALSIIRVENQNNHFIVLCLRGNTVSDFIKKNPTIGAQPNLSLEQVGSIEISLPDSEEQNKISTFLEKFDKQLEKNVLLLESLLKVKRALLQQLFI